jgi:hypothetical protein
VQSANQHHHDWACCRQSHEACEEVWRLKQQRLCMCETCPRLFVARFACRASAQAISSLFLLHTSVVLSKEE